MHRGAEMKMQQTKLFVDFNGFAAHRTEMHCMVRSKMVRGIPFDVRLPENTVTRAEAMRAFEDLRAQASDLPEMTLEEIHTDGTYGG